mmetsp:Transcript_58772/g.68680  ORF Transcript_58772/g.68680 Transcript_58772/m.68680 type:complete len:80 (+) Transcript_58772:690-929(+)
MPEFTTHVTRIYFRRVGHTSLKTRDVSVVPVTLPKRNTDELFQRDGWTGSERVYIELLLKEDGCRMKKKHSKLDKKKRV